MKILTTPNPGTPRQRGGPPGDPKPTRWSELARKSAHHVAQAARFTEVDDLGTLLLGQADTPLMTALNAWDGLVTAFDGQQMVREGMRSGERGQQIGGAVRVGLGLAGMWPGATGFVAEAALGAYCLTEGLIQGDREGAVMGLTQLGSSVGLAAASAGLGGHWGPALSAVSLAGRLAYVVAERNRP